MRKFILRGKKGGEATFTYNDTALLVAFDGTALDTDSVTWLLVHLPKCEADLFALRDKHKSELIEVPLDISFDTFWDTYDFKMGSKEKCKKLYNALTDAEQTLAITKISHYKRYLKLNEGIKQVYPERYISHRRFENQF